MATIGPKVGKAYFLDENTQMTTKLEPALPPGNGKNIIFQTIVAINYGQNEEFSQNIAFVGRTET